MRHRYLYLGLAFFSILGLMFWPVQSLDARKPKAQDTIVMLQKQVEVEPSNMDAWNALAKAYVANKHWAKAIDSAREAIALDPEYADAYFTLAQAYEGHNELELAITHYELAVLHQPGFDAAKFRLGQLYQTLGLINLSQAVQQQ